MDTITHALSGALLAIATAPGKSPSAAERMDAAQKLLLRFPHSRHPWRSRERPPGRSPSAAKRMDPGAAHPDALSQRARLMAGAAAAAFPDIDFALRAIDTLTYLNLHQGVTHSLILLPVWALGLAGR